MNLAQRDQSDWPTPQDLPAFCADTVDVWRIVIPEIRRLLPRLWSHLDGGERQRASRYHFQRDRDAFVARHGVLRALLGAYLGVPPAALAFELQPRGKPALAASWQGAPVHFNLSSSGKLALVAFSAAHSVGVDVQQVRADTDYRSIAGRFLPSEEVALFDQLPPHQAIERFFRLWTRMEACVKATGRGLEEAFGPAAAKPWCGEAGTVHPAGTFVVDLAPGEGYRAAVAAVGPVSHCRTWQCDPGRLE